MADEDGTVLLKPKLQGAADSQRIAGFPRNIDAEDSGTLEAVRKERVGSPTASVARELNHAVDSSTELHLEFWVARNDQRFQGTALGVLPILRLFFVRNGIPATLLHAFKLCKAIRSSRAANKQQSKRQVHRVSQSPAESETFHSDPGLRSRLGG